MDSESKKLLEQTLELAEENNKMLHSLKRHMQVSRIVSIVYWVFIIGSALGAYYLVQPYVDQVIGVYNGATEKVNSINSKLDGLKKIGL